MSDLRREEEERKAVVKTAFAPYKRAYKALTGLLLAGSCLSMTAGAWLLAASLLAILVACMISVGAWLSARTPAGDLERSLFPTALELAGVGKGEMPKGCLILFWPTVPLLVPFARAKSYIRAAKEGESGVLWLLGRLGSTDPFDRWRATVTLTKLKEARSIAGLTKALHDPDERVREASARGLVVLGHPEALAAELSDGTDDIVWLFAAAAAVRAQEPVEIPEWRLIRLINTVPSRTPLADLRMDEDEQEGWDGERLKALGTLPIERTESVVRELVRKRPELAAALFRPIGDQRTDQAREFLISMLSELPHLPEPYNLAFARGALYGLGQTKDPLALPAVERVQTEHPNADVRQLAGLIADALRREPDV